jgi:adenylate cyclase
MKIRFRLALLTLLIGLIVLTVSAIGLFTFWNARSAAEDLAGQVLEQTALGIDQQIEKLLSEATNEGSLNRKLLQSGRYRSDDFPQLVGYWQEVMAVHPNLTSLFIGLERTGESVGVSRLHGGKLSVWQTRQNPQTKGLALTEYWLPDYPDKPYHTEPFGNAPDTRLRPWYVAARRQGQPVWTDTYVFLGVEGVRDVLGVTHAVPFYRADGTLEAVLSADFDLQTLSHFLRGLRVGREGFAFVVELREDGSRRVIAHPQPDILVSPDHDLVPVDELADGRVQAFLSQLPTGSDGLGKAGAVRFRHGAKDYLGRYDRVQGEQRPHWLVGTILPEEDILAQAHKSMRWTFVIALAALSLAIVVSMLVSRQVAEPLEHLAEEAAAVGHLQLEAHLVAHSIILEVDRLATASEEMKTGLRSFQKYVPADLVRALLDSGQEAKLGGERQTVTIFFSDIADFTTISEATASEALVAHLGVYLGALSEEILKLGGTVDKFIGDAIMAFWGAPVPNPGQAVAACVAAWRCQQRLRELRPGWVAAGQPAFHTRIGIHTGEVIVGNIGSAARMNYTVIGDTVNLASRLEGLNKHYGTEVLLSEQTYQGAKEGIVARPIDWVAVKGRAEAVLVYELLGLAGQVEPATATLAKRYADALACYRRRDWREALRLLEEVIRLRPHDAPSLGLIARCRQYLETPPGEGWDGVYVVTSK